MPDRYPDVNRFGAGCTIAMVTPVTVTNTTSEAAFMTVTLPDGVIDSIGASFSVRAYGNVTYTNPTITFNQRIGTYSPSGALPATAFISKSIAITGTASAAAWKWESDVTVISLTTVECEGAFSVIKDDVISVLRPLNIGATVGVATAGKLQFALTWTWGTANTDSVTCRSAYWSLGGIV